MLKLQLDITCTRWETELQCAGSGATLVSWIEKGPSGWPVAVISGKGSQLYHFLLDNEFYFSDDEEAAEYMSDHIIV